jgi:hypothetical protein
MCKPKLATLLSPLNLSSIPCSRESCADSRGTLKRENILYRENTNKRPSSRGCCSVSMHAWPHSVSVRCMDPDCQIHSYSRENHEKNTSTHTQHIQTETDRHTNTHTHTHTRFIYIYPQSPSLFSQRSRDNLQGFYIYIYIYLQSNRAHVGACLETTLSQKVLYRRTHSTRGHVLIRIILLQENIF